MLRQDYILRMIQQLAQAVARLTARARTEDPAVVHAELHEALAQAEDRAEHLLTELETIDLPRDTILRLFRYRAATGRFAEAENALFDLVERDLANSAVIDEGRAFYRRLLDLEAEQLAAGELPRDEVNDGLAELEASVAGG